MDSPLNESQNVEFKQSWRDEFLKWICVFVNAQGNRDDGGLANGRLSVTVS